MSRTRVGCVVVVLSFCFFFFFSFFVAYAAPELGHTQTEAHRRIGHLTSSWQFATAPHTRVVSQSPLRSSSSSSSGFASHLSSLGATTAQRMPYATGSRPGQVWVLLLLLLLHRSWVVAQLVAWSLRLGLGCQSLGLSVCLLGCCAVGPT